MNVFYHELNLSLPCSSSLIFLKKNNLWFLLSQDQSYYFGGFYFKDDRPFKFLHSFNFPKPQNITLLSPWEAIFEFEGNQVFISLTSKNEIIIKSLKSFPFKVDLDSNFLFNLDPFKRQLKINKISSHLLEIQYFFENHHILSLTVESSSPFKILEKWTEVELNFDKKRNSQITKWWVLEGFETNSSGLCFKILEEKNEEEKEIFNFSQGALLNFLLRRIQNLRLNNYFPAGLPWFFENWYRDELLSLYLLSNFFKNKDIFLKKYLFELENKWNINKPQGLEAVDTLPLILLNLDEITFRAYLNVLEKFFLSWKEKYLKDEEFNFPFESTWMDTKNRPNALEIQVLFLSVLKRFSLFSSKYVGEAKSMEQKIKNKLKNNLDPNLPLIYLFGSYLLAKKDWEKIFDEFINEFYLDWGGISTERKSSSSFQKEHTGEDPQSYHSGDSWYFLNNLFAFALKEINFKKYHQIIYKVIKASLSDLLTDGALGFSSELSSAKERRSEGSLVQLWSLASLVKLLSTFKNPDIFLKFLSDGHYIVTIKS